MPARPTALLLCALALACAGENQREVAQEYERDTATLGGTHMSRALETPPLLPAIRGQLDSMESLPYERAKQQMDVYKWLVMEVADAIVADRRRLGLPAQEDWARMRDSILDPLGGGHGGGATGPDSPEALRRHTQQVRKLIAEYERAVKERGGEWRGTAGASDTGPTEPRLPEAQGNEQGNGAGRQPAGR